MSDTESSEVVSSPEQLTEDSEFSEVLDRHDRVLVDFYADWCGPCKMMEPVLEELAKDVDSHILKINVEDYPVIVKTYDVRAVPTLIVFEDGDPIKTLIGGQEKAVLQRALTE